MNSHRDFAFLEERIPSDTVSMRPCTCESSLCSEAGLLEEKGTCQVKVFSSRISPFSLEKAFLAKCF